MNLSRASKRGLRLIAVPTILIVIIVFPVTAFPVHDSPGSPEGKITVLAPNGGEVICPSHGEMVVSWSASGLPEGTLINVDLYKNGVITNHVFKNIPISPSSRKWGEMFASGAGGDGYKIRIATADGSVSDESDAPFSLTHVALSVTMVSPHGGEQWKLGEKHRIEWTWTGCPWGVTTITLWLLPKPWDHYKDVTGTISNMTPFINGFFEWTVGDLLGGKIVQPGGDYKIEVFSIVFVPTYAAAIDPNRPGLSAAPFSILAENAVIPPQAQPAGASVAQLSPATRAAATMPHMAALAESLRLVKPSGGERWIMGQLQRISWAWTGPSDRKAKILLYRGKRFLGSLGNDVPAATGFFDWKVGIVIGQPPIEPGEGYSIEVLVPAAAAGQEHRVKTGSPLTISPSPKRMPNPSQERKK